MSMTTKLIIPVVLGLAAAVVNWMAVNQQTQPVYFTIAKDAMAPGSPLLARSVDKIALPSQYASLKNTAVRYQDFGTVENSRVQRPLQAGDLILYTDCAREQHHLALRENETAVPVSLAGIPMESGVIRVGNEIELLIPVKSATGEKDEWVGPFRVITVGTDFTARQDKNSGRGNAEKITLAIPRDNSSIAKNEYPKLEAFLAGQRDPVPPTLKLVRLHSR